MAVAKLMAVGVCARVTDRVAERKKRLVRRLGQSRGMARRSDDGHAGDLPTDLGVVPVHPDVTRDRLCISMGHSVTSQMSCSIPN
ncbi:hypothetical protein [Jannaschia sp. 2305UL9-9]|uniref:hypothetical protein n=1 Tax=Jannaschia sp. 2305UL9-9 TaxID=3121638 RepID=UPI003527B885